MAIFMRMRRKVSPTCPGSTSCTRTRVLHDNLIFAAVRFEIYGAACMEALRELDQDLLQKLQNLINEGKTYEQISQTLQSSNVAVTWGLSARSV